MQRHALAAERAQRQLDHARVVGEEHHLRARAQLAQHRQRRARALVVEVHERVVEDERQHRAALDEALDAGDAQREVELIAGAVAQNGLAYAVGDARLQLFEAAIFASDPLAGKNNDIADQLTDLSTSNTGADQAYRAMVGQLGVAAQSSGRRSEIQDSVTQQVDTTRQAESGVNLDEEMTHMLTYQRGYEAASRVLTTVDSMLDQLINRTGLVGR